MSFLSDLFHGDFGNLGNDLAHAPSSFVNHPTEMLEAAGGAAALAAPFVLPELLGAGGAAGGLFGGGEAVAAGGAEAGADSLLSFGSEAASGAGDAQSAISSLLGTTGNAAEGGSSFYGAGFDPSVNPLMTDPNAFSAGNQLAGVGGDNLGGLTGGAGESPIASGTSFADAGGVGAGGDPISGVAGNAGKGAGETGFWDNLVGGVKNAPNAAVNSIVKNPLGIAAAGTGLALNMMNNKPNPNIANLQGQANQLTAQGQQFMSFLQNGTLPPALKASVDQASNAAKARIIANHAAQGQSTDPTQNSALAQELAAADQNALIAVGQLGEQLFTAGQSEIGLSSQIYQKLIAIDQQQSASQGKAIANFASALGSGAKAA